MAREAIRLQFGKYNGDEHWGFDAVVLGRDAQGLWLGVTGGTRVARPGLEFAAHGDFVVLGLIAVLCTVMFVRFKKERWL